MNWKILKKYWFLLIGLLILVYIVFPKECGHWDVLSEKNCKCYGILLENKPSGSSEGWAYSCYGICTSDCVCKKLIGENRIEVVCG